MRAFLDSNILVYRAEYRAPEKRAVAAMLVSDLLAAGDAVLSTQSLHEFYNAMTRKLGLAPQDARELAMQYSAARIVQVTPVMSFAAMQRHAAGQFSFWDALIIEAALTAGCKTLYSEDMQHGLVVDGLTITNPFLAA